MFGSSIVAADSLSLRQAVRPSMVWRGEALAVRPALQGEGALPENLGFTANVREPTR